jgi:hypothetical protein
MRPFAALSVALLFCCHAVGAEERNSSIGYPSVAAAFQALSSDPRAVIRIESGWTIVRVDEGEAGHALWSFTPEDHPAYPAVVKRTIFERDGAVMMDTKALCQSTKVACDKLMAEFRELDAQVREHMRRGGT